MNLEQRLRASLVPPDPGPAFTAKVMAQIARGRARPRRFIVIGALLLAGLAAAMLVWQANRTIVPAAATAEAVWMKPAVAQASAGPPAVAASGLHPEDSVRSVPGPEAVAAAAGPAAIRIVLMPVQHNSQDIDAKPAIDAFNSSLLQALRSQPGVVVETTVARNAAGQPANRVTVFSPRYTILPSGRRLYQSGNGHGNWQAADLGNRGTPGWPVEVLLELATLGTVDGMSMLEQSVQVQQFIDGNGILNGQSCSYSHSGTLSAASASLARSDGPPALCTSVDALAAWLVEMLRPRPPTPELDATQLTARLSDVSSPDRTGTLQLLLGRALRDGLVLDATAIKAITAYIASQMPEQRMSTLRMLRGQRQPGFVPLLADILSQDAEEKVRLEALAVLVADYRSDGRVRAHIETAARQDASQFVRVAAMRSLAGEESWQTYVMTTLADRSLSIDARLAPAQYDLQQQIYASGGQRTQSWLGSEQVTRQLVDIFQQLLPRVRQSAAQASAGMPSGLVERLAELGAPPGSAVMQFAPEGGTPTGLVSGSGPAQRDDLTIQGVLTLLSITNPAAATDLRLKTLAEVPLPPRWLVMNSLNDLQDRRDDPRVRSALDDIAAGKSGPELRGMLENSMAMKH